MDTVIPDSDLITQAMNNDATAFEALFARYSEPVYQMLLQKTGKSDDAKDLLQETFVRAFLNLHRYDSEYLFGQWIFTIARNIFIDFTRKRKDNFLSIDQPVSQINPPCGNMNPEESMISAQNSRQLDMFLDRLPPAYRQMIEMRYFREYSYEEIAEKLAMPIGTVKTQIHRARERLCKLISDNFK